MPSLLKKTQIKDIHNGRAIVAQKMDNGQFVTTNGGYVPLRSAFREDAFRDGPTRCDIPDSLLDANAALIVERMNGWDALQAELAQVKAERDRLRAAIEAALPLLVRLGDFIGNSMNRCEVILKCKNSLNEEAQS